MEGTSEKRKMKEREKGRDRTAEYRVENWEEIVTRWPMWISIFLKHTVKYILYEISSQTMTEFLIQIGKNINDIEMIWNEVCDKTKEWHEKRKARIDQSYQCNEIRRNPHGLTGQTNQTTNQITRGTDIERRRWSPLWHDQNVNDRNVTMWMQKAKTKRKRSQ